MAETLESIKKEIAKIAAEKADLKGIVDQQKETIKRQETTIGNLREALKAADANMVDRVNKLQEKLDHFKKFADEEHTHRVRAWDSNGLLSKENEQLQKEIDEYKEALDREATENAELQKKVRDYEEYKEDVRKLTELKEELKKDLEASKTAHSKTWDEKENFKEKAYELQQQVSKLEAIRDAYAKEIDVLNADNEELKQRIADGDNPGMIAALAAKDIELRKLGQKVPAKDREINDLKEQVKSLEKALDRKGDESYKLSLEKEHLANAIENAYRSLMVTRGYQLPGESGVSNG
nr:MAG TPA: chromosome segregation protein [Caudoviricetes sp.]